MLEEELGCPIHDRPTRHVFSPDDPDRYRDLVTGLFDVFASPWFAAVYLLLAAGGELDLLPQLVQIRDRPIQGEAPAVLQLDRRAGVRGGCRAASGEHGDERRATTRIFGSRPGTYGAEAASRHCFGRSAASLSERQAAEQLIQKIAAEVHHMSGAMPVLVLREGSRRDELLKTVVPESPSKPYDMGDLVRRISDEGVFFEVHAGFARNILVGFIRLSGRSVGVVANQPMQFAGTLDIDASEKAARFVRTCDAFNVPGHGQYGELSQMDEGYLDVGEVALRAHPTGEPDSCTGTPGEVVSVTVSAACAPRAAW